FLLCAGSATRAGEPFNPALASAAACTTNAVWAPPVSLAATPGILSFLRGTEMFQFPHLPPQPPMCSAAGDRVSPRPGCPIRISADLRSPATPRGVSSPGHVLRRPQTPRHPPCALLAAKSLSFLHHAPMARNSERHAPTARVKSRNS